jgi:hypothetical protein
MHLNETYSKVRTQEKDVSDAVGQDRRWKLGIFRFVRVGAEAPVTVGLCVRVWVIECTYEPRGVPILPRSRGGGGRLHMY